MRAVFLAAFIVLTACGGQAEAPFTLTSDSRLPKWVVLPKGVRRDEVAVELTFFASADPRIRVLKGEWPFRRTLQDFRAKGLDGHLEARKLAVSSSDPRYDFVYDGLVVDGVVDIVEHPCPCPDFRMSDDPDVWAAFAPSAPRSERQ
jgi:hypothetical protein